MGFASLVYPMSMVWASSLVRISNTADSSLLLPHKIVGRERRERVSQLTWCGEGCFDSRRRVNSNVMLLRLSLTIALLATSCTHAQLASRQIDTGATPTATPSSTPTPSLAQTSPIHKLDFENFTYPARPIFPNGDKTFTLKDGSYAGPLASEAGVTEPVSLVDTIYGDVTGDRV